MKEHITAFPFVSHGGFDQHQACSPGMTLLDYFAGQVLATYTHDDLYYGTHDRPHDPWPAVVRECYDVAELMMKEGERRLQDTERATANDQP